MKLTPREVYNIIEALKSRLEWVRDTDDNTGLDSEVVIMEELIKKFDEIYINLEMKDKDYDKAEIKSDYVKRSYGI